MLQQLLWAEVLLKGVAGLLLCLAPGQLATIAGLPQPADGFWVRLLGCLLCGIAAALLLQGSFPAVRTITPAGLIVLNIASAGMVVATLLLGKAGPSRRGRLLLWLLAVALALLTLFEVAYA